MKRLALLSFTLAALATPVHAQTPAQSQTVQTPGFNGLFFDKYGPGAPPPRATGMMAFMGGGGPSQAGPGPYRAGPGPYAGPGYVRAAPETPRMSTTRHVRRHVRSQNPAT